MPEVTAKTPVNDFLVEGADAEAKQADVPTYIYVGRAIAHTDRIVGIQFGVRDSLETLISVGEDRWVFIYIRSCIVNKY